MWCPTRCHSLRVPSQIAAERYLPITIMTIISNRYQQLKVPASGGLRLISVTTLSSLCSHTVLIVSVKSSSKLRVNSILRSCHSDFCPPAPHNLGNRAGRTRNGIDQLTSTKQAILNKLHLYLMCVSGFLVRPSQAPKRWPARLRL